MKVVNIQKNTRHMIMSKKNASAEENQHSTNHEID
jgi:hypothetical protein